MIKTFRYGYVQAKLHALIGSSFVRRDLRPLIRGADVRAIAQAVFPHRQYDLPERALARQLQADLDRELFEVIRRILAVLNPPPPVIVQLFRLYEYRMVRTLVSRLLSTVDGGSAETIDNRSVVIDPYWNLGPFATAKMGEGGECSVESLKKGRFAWVMDAIKNEDLFHIEVRLDKQYYTELLSLVDEVPTSERTGVLHLAKLEANLQNYVWILRMRTFFHQRNEQILPMLVPVSAKFPDKDTRALLDMPLDSLETLRSFRHSWLFITQPTVEFRHVDPALAEEQAELYLFKAAKRRFYSNPFSLALVYAFCKLKQFEVSRVTTVLEGMKMMLPEEELIGTGIL